MSVLGTLAEVVRSKNASPFRTTVDVFFSSAPLYERVKHSGVVTRSAVAEAYGIGEEQVEGVYFVDQACGIKITLRKTYPADHFLAADAYGAQQHLPILNLEIPETDVSRVAEGLDNE